MGCYTGTSDKLQREGTETHLLQSPNLSWMLGLKYNGRNTSKAQCFNHRHLTSIFSAKSSSKSNMDWVAPFKTAEVWRQLRQQISLSDECTCFPSFHRWTEVLSEQKQRGKSNSCRPHFDKAATHSPSIRTFPTFGEGLVWSQLKSLCEQSTNLASQRNEKPAALVSALQRKSSERNGQLSKDAYVQGGLAACCLPGLLRHKQPREGPWLHHPVSLSAETIYHLKPFTRESQLCSDPAQTSATPLSRYRSFKWSNLCWSGRQTGKNTSTSSPHQASQALFYIV